MKKSACLFAMLVILASCNSGNTKSENNQHQSANLSIEEAIEKKDAAIDYTQYSLAYLIEGVLYFHNFENNEKVKFVEESDTIFNFTFDTEGKNLYYSVEREGTLWLKAADISVSKVTPKWVVDWKLEKDDCIPETYGDDASPLLYHKGELLIEHAFKLSYYAFTKFVIYSIADKKFTLGNMFDNEDFFYATFERFRSDDPKYDTETRREQFYYTRNNVKICLTDKLNLNALKTKEDIDARNKPEFNNETFSRDETKIFFQVLLGDSEETFHGLYCIVNADGSKQMIVEETHNIDSKHPIWLKDNRMVFTNYERILFVANNDDNSVQKIAENVSSFVAR